MTPMSIGLGLGLPFGGGGGDAVLAKIIAALARGGLPTVMSSPPTTAINTGDSASLINGTTPFAPSIMLTDPRLRITGPIALVRADLMPTNVGYVPAWCSFAGGVYSGGNGWEIEFSATGLSTFDIACTGWAADTYGIRILVDDQYIGASDIVPTFGGGEWARYLKVTFAGAATRRIRIISTKNAGFVGINVNAGAVVSYPVVSPLESKLTCYSDSFGDTGGYLAAGATGTFSARLAMLIGHRFYPMGRSGQGYALAVDSRTINQRIPLDGPRVDVPDVVLLHGSVNDNAQLAATLQTNMADAVTKARALWPNAWIVVLSSFSSTAAPINAARNTAYYNGAMSVADSKTIVIDTTLLPLEISATTGTMPNAVAHDSPDGVHLGPNEIAYNDGLLLTAISARLRSKLTIFGLPSGFTRNVAFTTWTPTTLYASGAVAYALSGASLPAGLSFNTSTGAISGTPTAAGTTAGFVITATDAAGNVATIGPFQIVVAAGAALTSFDPANNFGTLSESNLRMTSGGSNLGARGTSSRASGQQYAEFEIVATAAGSIGVCNISALHNTWPAASGNAIAIDPSSGLVYSGGVSQGASGIGTLANGNILQVKLDRTAGTIQFGKNNTFGNVFNTIPTGAQFLFANGNSGLSVRIRTETTQFSYSLPGGYSAWN